MNTDQKKVLMKRALQLAENGRYSCSPNPMVGALILSNDKIVGKGFHKRAGEPHAEINAINDAADKAAGSTLFVTLEPCSTRGRTAPCTDAIIKAGIKKVVVGTVDPNPAHAGKGLDILKEAGVEVELLDLPECRNLNEKFNKFISTGLPFVHAKWAMTLDGKIAARSGDSKWISCEKSREIVHKLRAECDAVMTGSNTVLTDNPQLNVRLEGDWRQPTKIVVDGRCRTPADAKIFDAGGRVVIACSEKSPENKICALEKSGAEIFKISTDENNKINLQALMKKIAEKNIASVFVEGGSGLLGALFDAGLVDRATIFIAPKIIGGKDALTPVGGAGIDKISGAFNLTNIRAEQIDKDILITGNILHNF